MFGNLKASDLYAAYRSRQYGKGASEDSARFHLRGVVSYATQVAAGMGVAEAVTPSRGPGTARAPSAPPIESLVRLRTKKS